MSKYKQTDTTLHFCDGRLYVRETTMCDGKVVDMSSKDVTKDIAQTVSEYINK